MGAANASSESGCYNRRVRTTESTHPLSSHDARHNNFPKPRSGVSRKRKLLSRENAAKMRKVDLLNKKILKYERKIQQLDDILDNNQE